MQVMAKTKLKALREEFTDPRLAQEDMARECGLRVLTYRHIEQGRNTSYTKAMTVLGTVNRLRAERGMPEVVLDDLGLSIV